MTRKQAESASRPRLALVCVHRSKLLIKIGYRLQKKAFNEARRNTIYPHSQTHVLSSRTHTAKVRLPLHTCRAAQERHRIPRVWLAVVSSTAKAAASEVRKCRSR